MSPCQMSDIKQAPVASAPTHIFDLRRENRAPIDVAPFQVH
jgi:hypothetical protein